MTATIVGICFVLAGVWGMIAWFPDLMVVLKGFGSLSLFLGGVIALIAGISSFQAPSSDDKKEN